MCSSMSSGTATLDERMERRKANTMRASTSMPDLSDYIVDKHKKESRSKKSSRSQRRRNSMPTSMPTDFQHEGEDDATQPSTESDAVSYGHVNVSKGPSRSKKSSRCSRRDTVDLPTQGVDANRQETESDAVAEDEQVNETKRQSRSRKPSRRLRKMNSLPTDFPSQGEDVDESGIETDIETSAVAKSSLSRKPSRRLRKMNSLPTDFPPQGEDGVNRPSTERESSWRNLQRGIQRDKRPSTMRETSWKNLQRGIALSLQSNRSSVKLSQSCTPVMMQASNNERQAGGVRKVVRFAQSCTTSMLMHQEDSGTNHRPGTERDLSWRDLVGVLRGAEMDSLQLNQEDVELS